MENVNWSQYYKPNANLSLQGNPALDDLRQQYAQRQQQKQQENADFTKEIAKLNFNGSRDSDHGQLQQGYGDVIGTFAKLLNENDPKKRAELGLELQQKQNQFLYQAENSKVKGQNEQKLIDLAHRPDIELQDGALDKITDLTKTPYGKEWEQKYNDLQSKLIAPKEDPIKDAQEIVKSISGTTTTTSQRYNKETGRMENVATTGTNIPEDKFISSWVSMHSGSPRKVQRAIQETGIQDPAAAVLAQGKHMYETVSGAGKQGEKVTGAGMTMGNLEALQTHNAQVKQQYPSGAANQPTPFRTQTDLLGHLSKTNPVQAKQVLDDMVKLVPNHKNEIKTNITSDGTVAIDFPRTKTHRAEQARLDANSPLFPDLFAQKMRDHGVDISLYNSGNKGHSKEVQTQSDKSYNFNGKKLSHKDLLKAGYSEEKIKKYIEAGLLK
jgi:hypothetical protein